MDCPICLREACELISRGYKGMVVGCTRCGGFRITSSALGVIVKLPIQSRLAALEMARWFKMPRAWPTINCACLKPSGNVPIFTTHRRSRRTH
jgi:hypothetical protein